MLASELNEIRNRADREPRTPEQKDALFAESRLAWAREGAAYRSYSGADVAEAPVWSSVRDFYCFVAEGMPVDEALERADTKWRAYAEEQARKVNEAPKIKRGPSAGHSAIHHRWVSPDLFRSKEFHLRYMVAQVLSR